MYIDVLRIFSCKRKCVQEYYIKVSKKKVQQVCLLKQSTNSHRIKQMFWNYDPEKKEGRLFYAIAVVLMPVAFNIIIIVIIIPSYSFSFTIRFAKNSKQNERTTQTSVFYEPLKLFAVVRNSSHYNKKNNNNHYYYY